MYCIQVCAYLNKPVAVCWPCRRCEGAESLAVQTAMIPHIHFSDVHAGSWDQAHSMCRTCCMLGAQVKVLSARFLRSWWRSEDVTSQGCCLGCR